MKRSLDSALKQDLEEKFTLLSSPGLDSTVRVGSYKKLLVKNFYRPYTHCTSHVLHN